MYKNRVALWLFLVIITTTLNAQQQTGSLAGHTKAGNIAVPAATLQLSAGEKVIYSQISGADGRYEIKDLLPGNYQLKVTATGFQPGNYNISIASGKQTLQDINMVPDAKELAAVIVEAQRKAIEVRADKTVINVDASPTNAGANVLEVLEKSPGVFVDNDGNISLAGKPGVNVMIDGKPAQMSGADLAEYLKGIQAAQVDQIELVTQPSSKYEAEGNAGIINIRLKRNKVKGFNGNAGINHTQGIYGRTGINGFTGYRSGKWNMHINLNTTDHTGFNEINVERYFRKKGSNQLTSIFDQQTFLKYNGKGGNAILGIDYLLTPKTTLGFKANLSGRKMQFNLPTHMTILDAGKNYQGKTITYGTNAMDNANLLFNINMKMALDSMGREFTADVDYARYFRDNAQKLDNYFYDANDLQNADPYLLHGTNPSLFNIYSGKLDYIHPFKNQYKLEAGVKMSFVSSDNLASFLNKNNGTWQQDPRSNHFIYEENINAAYLNFSKNFKKLQLQGGVRAEQTNATGHQLTTGQQFNRRYIQLFPTAFASYKFNDQHAANLNLGRRIRRPDYDALNPFQLLLNPYTYQQGNPMLQPQFSYNSELWYIYKNGLLNLKLGYATTKNIIADVLTQDEVTTVSYVRPENLARQKDLLLQAASNINVNKFLTSNINVSVTRLHFQGVLSGYYHDIKFTSGNVNVNNQLKMGKGWSGELGGFYQFENLFSGNSLIKPFYMVHTGISKQLMNNKATVKLNVRDVFNSRRIQIDQHYHEFESYFTNRIDSRTVALSFTWKFAKNEKHVLKQRNTGASSEEQGRTGNK